MPKKKLLPEKVVDGVSEKAQGTRKYKLIFIEQIVMGLFRIPPNPAVQELVINPDTGKEITLQAVEESIRAYFRTPDISLRWLAAENSPTCALVSQNPLEPQKTDKIVLRLTAQEQRNIQQYQFCASKKFEDSNLVLPNATFIKLELDKKQLNRLLETGLYNTTLNSPTLYCQITEFLPTLRNEYSGLIAGNLASFYEEIQADLKATSAISDVLHIAKGLWAFLQTQQLVWLDIKASNFYKAQDGKIHIHDPKAFIDGINNGLTPKGNTFILQLKPEHRQLMTRAYTPSFSQEEDAFKISRLYISQLCMLLFELVTGNLPQSTQSSSEDDSERFPLEETSVENTKLGDLIQRGIRGELDDFGAFLALLERSAYLNEPGELAPADLTIQRRYRSLSTPTPSAHSAGEVYVGNTRPSDTISRPQ